MARQVRPAARNTSGWASFGSLHALGSLVPPQQQQPAPHQCHQARPSRPPDGGQIHLHCTVTPLEPCFTLPRGQPGKRPKCSAFLEVTPALHESSLDVVLVLHLGWKHKTTVLNQNKSHKFPRDQIFLLFLCFVRVLFL